MEISIIIPTFNREAVLKQTLDNLKPLVEKFPIEIIIVNDGEALKDDYSDEKIHVHKNPKKGVTTARNFGAANAKSDILFFLDDDMWCNEDAIRAILSFKKRGLTNTSCFLMNWEYPHELVESMIKEKIGRYLISANYHKLTGRLTDKIMDGVELLQIDSIGSCSFLIKKDIFFSIGGYDESYVFQGEDYAIAVTINKHKIPIYLYTPVTCFHNHKDRIDISGMMDRNYRGYYSQFLNGGVIDIEGRKRILYELLLPLMPWIIVFFQALPNSPLFDLITFRIIGVLGSLGKLKAYLDVKKNKST